MRTAQRSYLIGMHNPLVHSIAVLMAWIKIYRQLPILKEGLCIVFHNIGYLSQTSIDGMDNHHPEFGARMCGLMGRDFFNLCIAHSRDYAMRFNLPLSKLGCADKGSVLMYPDWLFKRLIMLGGEAQEYHKTTKTRKWGFPVDVRLIKADYRRWMEQNTEMFL